VGYADALDLVGKNSRRRVVHNITQDTREPDVITRNLLTGLGYTVERRAMVIGDYSWELRAESWFRVMGYVTFTLERKTLADLRDVGRLRRQLAKARHIQSIEPDGSHTFFIVMLEHRFDTDRKRKWPEESILNAELSIQLGGVRVTRCEGNDVAGRLHSLYQWSQKRTHQLAGGE
jgi:ERCC4-type nuclease